MGWRRDLRKRMRQQRAMARMSKRNAKKLAKIYGDMSPEEIAKMNDIAPDVAGGMAQLGNDPTAPPPTGDPVADMATYNAQYGEDEYGEQFDLNKLRFWTKNKHRDDDAFDSLDDEESGFNDYVKAAGDISGIMGSFVNNFRKRGKQNVEGLEDYENFLGINIKEFVNKLRGGKGNNTDTQAQRDYDMKTYGHTDAQAKLVNDPAKETKNAWMKVILVALGVYLSLKYVFKVI